MSLGASENWRSILEAMTEETEISTVGILEYFAPLTEFMKEENSKMSKSEIDSVDANAPILFSFLGILLLVVFVVLFCSKKHDMSRKLLSFCGLSKNGSLDIVTNEMPTRRPHDIDGVVEDKV